MLIINSEVNQAEEKRNFFNRKSFTGPSFGISKNWARNIGRKALIGAFSLTAGMTFAQNKATLVPKPSAPLKQNEAEQNCESPNIILLFTDDQGWGDLGCFDHPYLKTPNLDRLAKEGTRFENFYVNAPVCAPTRAAIMTGRYPAELGFNYIPNPSVPLKTIRKKTCPYGLDVKKFPTLSKLLKANGYVTGHSGKWHMGVGSLKNQINILKKGVNRTEKYRNALQNKTGENSYAYLIKKGEGNDLASDFGFDFKYEDFFQGRISKNLYNLNPKTGRLTYNSKNFICQETYSIFNAARDFIKKNRSKPFYLNIWTYVPHARLSPSKKELAVYDHLTVDNVDYSKFPKTFRNYLMKEKDPERRLQRLKTYMAAITAMDAQLGILMKDLKKYNLDRRTLIFFASDNGPEVAAISTNYNPAAGSAGNFRGRKRSIYEGGVRTPCIAWWPGHVPAGRVDKTSVISAIDWLPTVCAITKTPIPKGLNLKGENVSGILFGKVRHRQKPLYWRYLFPVRGDSHNQPPELAIRKGPWKFYCNQDGSKAELYNLDKDPGETDNTVSEHPDIAANLKKQTLAWNSSLPSLDSWDHLIPRLEKYFRVIREDTFDNCRLRRRPPNCRAWTEKDDRILISEDPEGKTGRCIMVKDAPIKNPSRRRLPVLHYDVKHCTGITTVSFDLRIGPGAKIRHYWWFYGIPKVSRGPMFIIRDSKLFATRKKLMNLPDNQWIHFELSVGNGKENNGKWTLSVTCPNQPTEKFTLPVLDKNYREATSFEFSSPANNHSVYWLDNIKISNSRVIEKKKLVNSP